MTLIPFWQMAAQSSQGASPAAKAGALAFGGAVLLVILAFALVVYLFVSFCYKRICEKAGHQPGILVWIPLAQFYPLVVAAGLPGWMFILALIPFVNIVFFFVLWFKLFEARGKPGWLVVLFLIPLAPLILIPYLAFSE